MESVWFFYCGSTFWFSYHKRRRSRSNGKLSLSTSPSPSVFTLLFSSGSSQRRNELWNLFLLFIWDISSKVPRERCPVSNGIVSRSSASRVFRHRSTPGRALNTTTDDGTTSIGEIFQLKSFAILHERRTVTTDGKRSLYKRISDDQPQNMGNNAPSKIRAQDTSRQRENKHFADNRLRYWRRD